jgi:hypothetical protein
MTRFEYRCNSSKMAGLISNRHIKKKATISTTPLKALEVDAERGLQAPPYGGIDDENRRWGALPDDQG